MIHVDRKDTLFLPDRQCDRSGSNDGFQVNGQTVAVGYQFRFQHRHVGMRYAQRHIVLLRCQRLTNGFAHVEVAVLAMLWRQSGHDVVRE